jgi:thioredoxin 1
MNDIAARGNQPVCPAARLATFICSGASICSGKLNEASPKTGREEFGFRRRHMAGQSVVEVNDANFDQEVLQSEQPVLVDFWAAWCGPCKALAPIVDEVATQFNGKLKVAKMDVDRNSATPMRYGIRGIPALLLFKGGKVADQIVGYVPKDTIEKSITRVVDAPATA